MTVDGKRNRGRTTLRWRDMVKEVMARNQMTTEMAEDRKHWHVMIQVGTLRSVNATSCECENKQIYAIIRHKSVELRKLQLAILARSPREMTQTDRILPRYILSRVRVSVRPRIFLYVKNPQTTVARPAAVDHRTAADKQLNWSGHNPFSWVAQRQELSAKTLLRNAAIRVHTPCREQYFFTFIVCD